MIVRYENVRTLNLHYLYLRWTAKMTAVEIYAVWERYAEARLIAALNHSPHHFLSGHEVYGVRVIPAGLAAYLTRAGRPYFDFRSMEDLINKADRLVGKTINPFRKIPGAFRGYLDTLSAIRNFVAHKSKAAITQYRTHLRRTYSMKFIPEPDEFLNARDYRKSSPARYETRLHGLAKVVEYSIDHT